MEVVLTALRPIIATKLYPKHIIAQEYSNVQDGIRKKLKTYEHIQSIGTRYQ